MARKKSEVENLNKQVSKTETADNKKEAKTAKKQRTEGTVATEEVKKKRGRPKKVVEQKEETGKTEKVEAELVRKKGYGGNGNLRSLGDLSTEEQRKICTKGGVASVAARRRKKELREFTRDFLMQEAAPILQGNMKTLGCDAEQLTNLAAMVLRLFNKAVNNGDLNSARTLIEWAGMAPLQQERENEAIARMSQVMQLAGEGQNNDGDGYQDVVFYIPDNGRSVVTEEDMVTV